MNFRFSDGDMVEIVARKTQERKNSHKLRSSSSSEDAETSCATEELHQPKRVLDIPVIDVNGYDLNLDSLIRLGKSIKTLIIHHSLGKILNSLSSFSYRQLRNPND